MDDGPFRVPRPVDRRAPVRTAEPEPVAPAPVPVIEPEPASVEQQPVDAPRRVVSNRPFMKEKKDKKPLNRFAVLIAVVVVIVVAIVVGWVMISSQQKASNTATGIDSSKYQAVFFTNSQVYFGKLTMLNNDYMQLTNVYYLQTPSTGSSSTSNSDQTSVLVKLDTAVHGPEDTMMIAKDQVLFYENLAPSGKVAQLIAAAQK